MTTSDTTGHVDITVLRSRMAELQEKLQGLELEKEAVEEQLSDILADRLLGKRIPLDTLSKLEIQQRENSVDIATTLQTIEGLQARLDRYEAEEKERKRTLLRPEVERTSVELDAAQQAMYDAVRVLSDANEAVATAEEAFNTAQRDYERFGGSRDDFKGLVQPRGDRFQIPERTLGIRHGVHGFTMRNALERWLAEPEENRKAMEADLKAQAERAAEAVHYYYSEAPAGIPSGSIMANELALFNLKHGDRDRFQD